ncbi:NAC domain containing protein [Trema orientale]|uniref:NAC domain containing protein n=1 Tax=Trema orientale TaxID=63057 RepID=A0A2P5BFR0_TREOI|nr:NAC domain containing protein [Trema orientale]
MERSWLINSRGIAKKVKSASRSSAYQIKDCGGDRECPNCHYRIDNSDVSSEWPGLPAGVKFEPSDEELVEHLAGKCGAGNIIPHLFIDEFIPTLEGEGIYCDHPENLPGAKKDGSSTHFFHKTINAYSTGQRKRRKVQTQQGSTAEHVRWHKTGKTKAVIENGVQKGWKKIMVLYKSTKGSKPDKTNWVMHQYHLGAEEDEKEGEYVVSKIYYQQPKQSENNETNHPIEEFDTKALQAIPKTPNSDPPVPPRHGKSIPNDDITDTNLFQSSAKEGGLLEELSLIPQTDSQGDDKLRYPWLAGESQAVDDSDLNSIDNSLLCKETFDSRFSYIPNTDFTCDGNTLAGESIPPCGISDLENLELDTPPDFQLSNLQFCSQDSILDWLDWL